MLNKNMLLKNNNIGGDKDLLKKADYWVDCDSFSYRFVVSSPFPDTFYVLENFNIVNHSSSFSYPWNFLIRIYSESTFDIGYYPNVGIYSSNLTAQDYLGVVYINDLVFTTEFSDGTSDTTITNGVDGINGATKWCTSKRTHPATLGNFFDNNIYTVYPEDTLINVPIFLAFYANEIPDEVKKIAIV